MAKGVEISVVIPAYNEEKYLGQTLEALNAQTFKNFETIVVDGGSKDRTRAIAKRYGAKVIAQKSKTVGGARNDGARVAKGDLIFFTNADTAPSSGLLRLYHDLFRDKRIVAASGPLLPLEKTTLFIRFGYRFASVYLAKFAYLIGSPSMTGSNMAVRRSAFRKSGGFDTSLVTYEDLDLTLRLKKHGKVVFHDLAKVKTSTRRIVAWGVPRYIYFNAMNVAKYNFTRKAHGHYEVIR